MVLRLMCEWDFEPEEWGGIGFRHPKTQKTISDERGIIAIYITKDTKVKRAREKRWNVVGFVEISAEKGNISQFVGPCILRNHLEKTENKDRWRYAVGISRAWMVTGTNSPNAGDNWQKVKTIFPNTYRDNAPVKIGGVTARIEEDNLDRMYNLIIRPAGVYKPALPPAESQITTVGELLTP